MQTVPRLISQLYDESIFTSIGHREFQIPRGLLLASPNSPNYFSLGFAAFFSHPDKVFPGLDREGLIRPPAILPPSVPNRSPDIFAELLLLLQGYPLEIRGDTHRQQLLRDARYFHFKGLEQQLIPHHIGYNPLRRRDEIVLRLENVQKSGIGVVRESRSSSSSNSSSITDPSDGSGGSVTTTTTSSSSDSGGQTPAIWVNYMRPLVDSTPRELVLEIGGDDTRLHVPAPGSSGVGEPSPRAQFFRDTRARVAKLFEVVATKLNLPPTTQPLGLLMGAGGASSQPATPGNTPLSEDLVRVALEPEAAITLDGEVYDAYHLASSSSGGGGGQASNGSGGAEAHPRKRRRRTDDDDDGGEDGNNDEAETWTVRTGQWRLRVQPAATQGGGNNGAGGRLECVLVAVKLDAVSSERARNATRGFLGS
ncbi:hypothetical protein JDV02_006069 [Purpureocillium takamizusanense]|uniref:Uncharacterized protein n=1 Tax=Purpureocillium takamizusanense TaxID=2060973 RepID=A0A9Q8VCD8_9HYPO|nr:uncharacterized protein JDV02_006069 [Purpureocillium takamizusanense]UNI19926.1 hypothetical protein JDV02_006069 [Purpureocillium takamizusanense]